MDKNIKQIQRGVITKLQETSQVSRKNYDE
jgi:hypothetical protein